MTLFFRNKPLAVIVSGALGVMVTSGAAHAFEAKISGHLNRMIIHADDGQRSEVFHADNVNSQTRFRFTGTQDLGSGLKAGINWEVGWTSNPSDKLNMTTKSVASTLNERHVDIFFQGLWGTVSLGQGDGAANGGMEVDLSDTTVIQYSGVQDIGGAFAFQSGGVAGPTISATTNNLDFESRYDRIRYDTPSFGPVSFAVSSGTTGDGFDATELAANLATELGAGKLAGTLGWSSEDRGGAVGDEATLGGSISYLARNGFNVTFANGKREVDTPGAPEKKFNYVKLGYKYGKHAVSADYGEAKDHAAAGDKGKVYGIAYVWSPEKWVELYAGLKQHQLERPGTSFDDIRFLSVGTRIKF